MLQADSWYTLFTDPFPQTTTWFLSDLHLVESPSDIRMAYRVLGGPWVEVPILERNVFLQPPGDHPARWVVINTPTPTAKRVLIYNKLPYPVWYGYGGNRLPAVDLHNQADYPLKLLERIKIAVHLNNIDLLGP
jgi:hypothetical protein